MDKEQESVREFHKTFGLLVNDKPTWPSDKECILRYRLIREELEEFGIALLKRNLVEVADALTDLIYVIKGAGCTFGIDLEPVFEEVHKSNMTKVGGHKDEGGKWIKPSTYKPPRIDQIIRSLQCENHKPEPIAFVIDKAVTWRCDNCGVVIQGGKE